MGSLSKFGMFTYLKSPAVIEIRLKMTPKITDTKLSIG